MEALKAEMEETSANLKTYTALLAKAIQEGNEKDIERWSNLVAQTTALLTEEKRQLAGLIV